MSEKINPRGSERSRYGQIIDSYINGDLSKAEYTQSLLDEADYRYNQVIAEINQETSEAVRENIENWEPDPFMKVLLWVRLVRDPRK